MCSKENTYNLLGYLLNRNKEKVNCSISMFGYREYLLDNDCYVSLAIVLTQIQYGSVYRSHQLLRCMGTRLNPIEAGGGGKLCPLQIFAFMCQNGLQ